MYNKEQFETHAKALATSSEMKSIDFNLEEWNEDVAEKKLILREAKKKLKDSKQKVRLWKRAKELKSEH